jgi:hypothetical protein
MKKDEPNYFREFLALHSDEELIRLQRRAQIKKLPRLAEFLGDEIAERAADPKLI